MRDHDKSGGGGGGGSERELIYTMLMPFEAPFNSYYYDSSNKPLIELAESVDRFIASLPLKFSLRSSKGQDGTLNYFFVQE